MKPLCIALLEGLQATTQFEEACAIVYEIGQCADPDTMPYLWDALVHLRWDHCPNGPMPPEMMQNAFIRILIGALLAINDYDQLNEALYHRNELVRVTAERALNKLGV